MKVVQPAAPRHRIERDGRRQERVRIPTRRNWFVFAFLPVWLVMWTIGGVSAIHQLVATGEVFLALWLVAWAFGWVFAAATLAMQIKGAETLYVDRGELEVTSGAGPLRRTWRFSGDAIRDLSSSSPVSPLGFGMRGLDVPFFTRPSSGAVRFSYGARTIYLANAVDEPEGRIIAEWLARRLPRGATEPT